MEKPILEMTMRDCLLTEKQLRSFAREIETLSRRKKSSFYITRKGVKYKKNCLVQLWECRYIGYPTVNLNLNEDDSITCEIYYNGKEKETFTFNKAKADEIYIMLAEAYDKIEEKYLELLERIGAQ